MRDPNANPHGYGDAMRWLAALLLLLPLAAQAADVELPARRTENAKVFNRNGKTVARIYQGPIHYKDDSNTWQDINVNMALTGTNEWTNQTMPYGVRVSKSGANWWLDIGDRKLLVTQGFQLGSSPTVTSNRIAFNIGPFPCRYDLSEIKVKLTCTIAAPLGYRELSFNTRKVGGTNWSVQPDGSLLANGLVIPVPHAEGADGRPYDLYASWVVEQNRVTFQIDDSAVPVEAYPYELDPTTIYSNTSDGHIYGQDAVYTTAQSTSLIANSAGGSNAVGQDLNYAVYRAYFAFDTNGTGLGSVAQINLGLNLANDASTTDFDVQIRDYAWTAPLSTDRETKYDDCIAATLDQVMLNTSTLGSINQYYVSPNLDTTYANATCCTGLITYCLTSAEDAAISQPTTNEYILWYTVEEAGTSRDPYVEIVDGGTPTPTPAGTTTPTPTETVTPTLTPTPTPTITVTPCPHNVPCHGHECAPHLCEEPAVCPSGYYAAGTSSYGDAICLPFPTPTLTATPTPTETATPTPTVTVTPPGGYAFTYIDSDKAGSETVVADSNTDTLNFTSGSYTIGMTCLSASDTCDLSVTLMTAQERSTFTSSASGMQADGTVGTGGLGLLQGCEDSDHLEWNETSNTWQCAVEECHAHACASKLCVKPPPCPSGFHVTAIDELGNPTCASNLPVTAFVAVDTPAGTTSATLEDVPGMYAEITLESEGKIVVHSSFEVETISGGLPSEIAIAININGVDYYEHARALSGSSDKGIGSITRRTDGSMLPPGTYAVKLRFRRVSGSSTPGLNNATMYVEAVR